jgi:hypothetical protein
LFLFIFTVSCTTERTEVPEAENEIAVDFNGNEFIILTNKTDMLGYKEDTVLADSLHERISKVENTANCTVKLDYRTDINSYVPASIAAGTDCGNLFFIDAYEFRTLGNGGYLLDIAEYSDTVDYRDSFRWGTRSTLELMTCNGVLYGVTPASWIDHLTPYYFVLVANDSILIKNGFAAPVEYYEKKTWTLDLLEDIVKTCYDEQSGIYGIESNYEFIARMALYCNGFRLVDENNQNGWYSENATIALNWTSDFLKNNIKCIANTGATSENFMKNSAALCTTDVIRLCQNIAFSDVDSFTVLPFPSGKSVEYGYMGGFLSTNMCCIGIPVSSDTIDESAYLINNIFAPMEGLDTLEDLKAYYTTNLFFHKSDIELVFELASSAEYNYWVENVWGSVASITSNIRSKSATELIQTYTPKLDKYLTDYVIPNKQGLNSYFN